jgi:hypothetical protein
MRVVYVDHSIGNNFGNRIELNKDLKKYPELHNYVLTHELGHTNNQKWNITDLKHDMNGDFGMGWELMRFCFRHPRAFWQFSPATRSNGVLHWDLNLILLYFFLLIIFAALIYGLDVAWQNKDILINHYIYGQKYAN